MQELDGLTIMQAGGIAGGLTREQVLQLQQSYFAYTL
jgi:hypothetical protein